MARLLLSKATLVRQRQQLKACQRFLPSLELKRQQLMQAFKDQEGELQRLQTEQQDLQLRIGQQLPMLAIEDIDLDGLCRLQHWKKARRNLVGVWLDELSELEFELATIPLMAKPHWVAPLQHWLQDGIRLQLQEQLAHDNLAILATALRKVTQRVNLFDKVLIPETRGNIRTIQVYLDDKAREAVVTSKIAKAKQQAAEQGGVS